MGKAGIVLAGMLLVVGGVALASDATLKSMTGSVLVDSGNDFQDAGIGAELNQGDRVMVMEGAEAVVRYETGCEEIIKGSQIITIAQPCKALILAGALAGANTVAVAGVVTVTTAGLISGDGNNSGVNPPPASP